VRVFDGAQGGVTYLGAGQPTSGLTSEEGTSLVMYADARAEKKQGGHPTCHVEVRIYGARRIRAAVGPTLSKPEEAFRRVRLLPALNFERLVEQIARGKSAPPRLVRRYLARTLQDEDGSFLRAHDAYLLALRLKLDPRALLGRGTLLLSGKLAGLGWPFSQSGKSAGPDSAMDGVQPGSAAEVALGPPPCDPRVRPPDQEVLPLSDSIPHFPHFRHEETT
jgi:hypothetical protein